MVDLSFAVERVEVERYAVAPQLKFRLRIAQPAAAYQVQSIALRVQLRIEPTKRHYTPAEQEALVELFGEPPRWGQTLRSMLWTHASVTVPAFTDAVEVDLPVACSYDFNVAATKYFAGLDEDQVPLVLLFSGTMFYAGEAGQLQIAQISWEKEVAYRLDVGTWREMMEHYYPGSVWLRVPKDVFARLREFKLQNALVSIEQALERLLPPEGVEATR